MGDRKVFANGTTPDLRLPVTTSRPLARPSTISRADDAKRWTSGPVRGKVFPKKWWEETHVNYRVIAAAIGLALSALLSTPSLAQGYPEKPVTLIVPWPAGGSTDVAMRTLAEAAAKHLGGTIIVDNKPGASGTL